MTGSILASRRGVLAQAAFSPLQLSGLGLWLRSESLALADGAAVAAWNDESGSARHASQATGANQPTYLAAPAGFNGKPAVDFDGATDVLAVTTGLDLTRNVPGVTILVASRSDTVAAGARMLFFTSTPAGAGRASLDANNVAGQYRGLGRRLDADGAASATAPGTVTTNTQVVTGIFDYANADAFLYINGTLGGSNLTFQTAGSSENTDSLAINVGSAWDGRIAELLVYRRALTDAERLSVERYLGGKYAVTVA